MLAIEKGRHQKPKIPECDRLCIYCKSGAVENEVHMLIDCPYYTEERTQFLSMLLLKCGDIFKNIHNSTEAFLVIMGAQKESTLFLSSKIY